MNLRLLPLVAALLAACAGSGAAAQTSVHDLPEKLTDSNGVDLPAGRLIITFPLIHFGDHARLKADYYARYPEAQVSVPSAKWAFDFLARPATGSSDGDLPTFWTPLGQAAYYTLATWETVMPDGRAFSRPAGGTFLTQFWSAHYQTPGRAPAGMYDSQGNKYDVGAWVQNVLTSWVYFTDGEIWTIKRQKTQYAARLRNVVSNRGYMIQYEYQREAAPTVQAESAAWQTPMKMSGGLLSHHYCDTSGVALCPALSAAGNSVTISHFANGYEVSHASGFKKRLEAPTPSTLLASTPGTNSQMSATTWGSACDMIGHVGQVTKNGQTWTYSFDQCTEEERGMSWVLTRTDPMGKTITVRQASSYSIPHSFTDEIGRESGFGGGPDVGYAGFSHPEGNSISIAHDARNNRTASYTIGKNNAALVTTSTYDQVCANLVTCNRPKTTTDANGNTSSFTYDPVHGGLLTRTGPAVNGVSPQTRYEYAQRHSWLKNASGGYSPSATPIWVLVRERYCRTTAPSGPGCAGGASDEVVTDYDFGPNAGPQTLVVRGVAVTADGQTRRTCYGYDQMDRKISETQPRADLASCS